MLGCFFKQCATNVVMDRWTRKCSAWQNARRHLIARAEKSARIASRITICGTYLQRGALNRRGYSDRFALAWTQRRWCISNEDIRPFTARALYRAGPARFVHTGRDEAGGRDSIPGNGMTPLNALSLERILCQ